MSHASPLHRKREQARCYDADSCESSSRCEESGVFLSQRQCCCDQLWDDGSKGPKPKVCDDKNTQCEEPQPVDPGGWPPEWTPGCAGLSGETLKNCCLPYDMMLGGKLRHGYSDAGDKNRYPDACKDVNRNFDPDQRQEQPVGKGQRTAYCEDYDSLNHSNEKWQYCDKVCQHKDAKYADETFDLDMRLCKDPDCNPDYGPLPAKCKA
jgi:hypothetical protein